MTIDEAFESLENEVALLRMRDLLTRANAVKLGIEALKAWQHMREGDNQPELWMLPGETEK